MPDNKCLKERVHVRPDWLDLTWIRKVPIRRWMRFLPLVVIVFVFCSASLARTPKFEPNEEQTSQHRGEVYKIARDYIVNTFNVVSIKEGQFNPVRFNSTGVWGDFRSRIKELGHDRFEVRGWILADGYEGSEIVWSVVLRYNLIDPDGWKYRRLDETFVNEPEITSWHFGKFRSVPYDAEYADDFLAENGDN